MFKTLAEYVEKRDLRAFKDEDCYGCEFRQSCIKSNYDCETDEELGYDPDFVRNPELEAHLLNAHQNNDLAERIHAKNVLLGHDSNVKKYVWVEPLMLCKYWPMLRTVLDEQRQYEQPLHYLVLTTDTPIMAIYRDKGYIGMPGPVEAS